MPYTAPIGDFEFIFDKLVALEEVAKTDRFSEATPETVSAILSEAAKLCQSVLDPLQRPGDLNPARLENGVVITPPGFAEGYRAVADGGWVGISSSPEHGGMGLPQALATAVNEMMSTACLSLQLNPLMSQGQIEALEHHASPEIQATYLPKLISGEWNGTMNLTEPEAGSDVGALRSRAVKNDDGTYAVSGQKIYISWGDNDFTANTCHLVLARLPDGAAGTKGISLFLVPKYIPDADGQPGRANSLRVVSLEHKLGLHGSPTAVMEYDGATGWLIGKEHGGMAAMFTMMNNARLGVGVQGIGVAEGAYQKALAYAKDRKQGRANGSGAIIEHPDIRRTLLEMKADIFAARTLALGCAVAGDMFAATGDPFWSARAAFLTPIAKAYGTEVGISAAQAGIQVHGGMGYIEETGAAQYLRDGRVLAIYEGTNGIQAMDLVGRKLADGGEAAGKIFDDIESWAEMARNTNPRLAKRVWSATETLREKTEWMVAQENIADRLAGATPFLRAFARVLGAHVHLKSALMAGPGPRTELARFYILRMLPAYTGLLAHATEGVDGLYTLSNDDF